MARFELRVLILVNFAAFNDAGGVIVTAGCFTATEGGVTATEGFRRAVDGLDTEACLTGLTLGNKGLVLFSVLTKEV